MLIDRGSEVGGGDTRSDVGVVADDAAGRRAGGGRFAVVTVGTRRIRVDQWLPDDPYPRADVEEWPDGDGDVLGRAARGDAGACPALCRPRRRDG